MAYPGHSLEESWLSAKMQSVNCTGPADSAYNDSRLLIYIYIYIGVLFGRVKPELGVIPSGQENHSGAEHLHFPCRELNVIDFTEQYFFKE